MTVGIYKLIMKEGSDNFRFSAVLGIIERLKSQDLNIIIYEPKANLSEFLDLKVIKDIAEFKLRSDVIIANRMNDSLEDVKSKCFSRDLFGEN